MSAVSDYDREDFLNKGSQVMEAELEREVDYVIEIQNKTELKNSDIISSNLVVNKTLNDNIKKHVKEYSGNLQKILLATADYIEEKKFATVDDAIKNLDLSKYDEKRVLTLLNSQKKLSFSFETLNVVIELFSRVNESLLKKIRDSKESSERFSQTKLHLKNAVLVHELTDFTAKIIKNYVLEGVEDIFYIRDEALKEIERNEKEDEKLKSKLDSVSEQTKIMIEQEIKNRNEIRQLIRKKWSEFDSKISSMEQGVNSTKSIVSDIEAIRDSAKIQVDILHFIATIQVVERNLEVVKNLAHIKNFALAPLTPEDACKLLGITVQTLPVNSEGNEKTG